MAIKSDENWAAAEVCLKNKHINAAANRFYYALYQSARFWLDKIGDGFRLQDSARDVHATTANCVGNQKVGNARLLRDTMLNLCELRVTADYKLEPVDEKHLAEAITTATTVRQFFLQ